MPDAHQTALRLIQTLRLLPRYPNTLTVREPQGQLASSGFEVDPRTIQRNLSELSVRYAIYGDEGRPQRWCCKTLYG